MFICECTSINIYRLRNDVTGADWWVQMESYTTKDKQGKYASQTLTGVGVKLTNLIRLDSEQPVHGWQNKQGWAYPVPFVKSTRRQ